MNSKALGGLYDRLTTRERLPLILAAEARGDEVEQQRLANSAPVQLWRFADYLWPNMALNLLTLMYLTEQLDHLASFWHALWRLDGPEEEWGDWQFTADVSAYVYCCNADAWRRFCGELGIDAEAQTAGNYRGKMLRLCEPWLRESAPTRDELAARLRARGDADPEPVTADGLLASWRSLFDACTGHSFLSGQRGGNG
jgi:hypothetical protein